MVIKSLERVLNYGEVFTSEREVNAMLDLVHDETQRIDSRFLEPACGTGNFLAEILRRKLDVVARLYSANQLEYERYTFQAVGSIYGIDILMDNVEECRSRLLDIVRDAYTGLYKHGAKGRFVEALSFVLSHNILWGDALTLKEPDSETLIIFSQWSMTTGSFVKRTDYTFSTLLADAPTEDEKFFSDLGEQAFIPKPCAEYRQVHFLEVMNAEVRDAA